MSWSRQAGWVVAVAFLVAFGVTLLAWRYGDVRWLALFTGFGPVELPGFDWSRSVGAHGWRFDEAALTFAGACLAATLGGIAMGLRWRRVGGALLVVSLGVTLLLASHLVPPVLGLMAPVGLLGLVAFVTAPKVRTVASAAEVARVRSAIAGLTRDGPLRFELASPYFTNLALGAVVILPGLLYWHRGRSYAVEVGPDGIVTAAGVRFAWTSLAQVHMRSFRRRGWNIGSRIIELEFMTGDATLEQSALAGPFAEVWSALSRP